MEKKTFLLLIRDVLQPGEYAVHPSCRGAKLYAARKMFLIKDPKRAADLGPKFLSVTGSRHTDTQ